MQTEMRGLAYGERRVLFLVLIQNSLYLESQKFGAKIGISFFICSRLSAACEIRPPSAGGVCWRWGGTSLFMGFQSTQWLMMRGHIVPDVWEFVQTDAHVGDLGVCELSSLFKTQDRLTVLAMNLMSSSSLSRDALKALSVFGGLYRLKNCSGDFSENTCDSIAASASK